MQFQGSRFQRWTVLAALVLGAIVGIWSASPTSVPGVVAPSGQDGNRKDVVATGPPTPLRGTVLLEVDESTGAETAPDAQDMRLHPPPSGTCTARAWQRGQPLGDASPCDARGNFLVEVPGDIAGSVAVEMLVPGRLRAVVSTEVVSGAAARLPTVALGIGQRVAGEVVDGRGQPVAGASVQAMPDPNLGEPEPWRTQTDAQGGFAFDTLPPGPVIVRAWKRGFATSVGQAIAPSEEMMLTLDALTVLRGEVAADAGLLARMKVRLEGSAVWPAREIEPQPDGKFVFDELPDGIYGLEAVVPATDDDASEWASFPLENVAPDMYVSLALVEAFRVPVRVVDTGGNPVPRARITLAYSAVGLLQRVAEADVHGRARVGPVVPGPYIVRADADGFLPAEPKEADITMDGGVEPVTLVLARPARIEGKVVDEGGTPVAGALVMVDSDGVYSVGAQETRADVFRDTLRGAGALGVTTGPVPDIPAFGGAGGALAAGVETGHGGAFVIDGLVPGTYRLRAAHGRYAESKTLTLRLASGEVRTGVGLVLGTGHLLTGRVLDGNRRPLAGAELEFSDGTSTRTDARGVFDGGHRRGRQRVVVRAPGMVPQVLELAVDRDRDVEAILEPAEGTFAGRVHDRNGQPVADARVRLQTVDGLSPTRFEWTDERGTFSFDELPTSRVEVDVDHPDFAPQDRTLAVDRDPKQFVEIELAEGWTAQVLVRDGASGAPVAGAAVMVDALVVVTDEEGRAILPRLTGPRVTVHVEADGFTAARGRLLPSDESDPLLVELDAGGGLEGTVTDYRGDPVPNASVVIQPARGELLRTRSDGRGQWRVGGVAEGDVVVEATPPVARAAELARDRVLTDVLAGRVTRDIQVRFDRR